jgi:hypothetical protein
MTKTNRWKATAAAAILLALPIFACSDSSSPDVTDVDAVVGTYSLTVLRFDPQGTLPDQDILAVLEPDDVQLTLTSSRAAQLVYRDPATQLIVTIQGTFRATAEGIRLEWASNSQYRDLLLSRIMNFTFNAVAQTLVFDGEAPDGVSRARLQTLVQAFQGEQLLDPTPGRLRVTFTRS